MIEKHLSRNHGHPWDGRPGFDLLEIRGTSKEEIDAFVKKARERFWHAWIVGEEEGTHRPCAVLYKPCGQMKPWEDDPTKGTKHPGNPPAQ